MPAYLEVAVFSGAAGLQAQSLGAHRIELNAPGSYGQGGLTPPLSELTSIASQLMIPARIMIRPRGPPPEGPDFFYTDSELEQMLHDIRLFKASGAMDVSRGDGFVFGVLKRETDSADRDRDDQEDQGDQRDCISADEAACRELVEAAQPFSCVFHRAFDVLAARMSRIFRDSICREEHDRAIIRCGFRGILTAGGQGNCADNVDNLVSMQRSFGGELQIIAGGGLRSHGVKKMVDSLSGPAGGADLWLHTAALRPRDDDNGSQEEHLDADELSRMCAALGLGSAR